MTSLAMAALGAVAVDARMARFPAVYGDQVAFTYASDLWVGDLKGGMARRLTSYSGSETRPKWSPDGKWIAFMGGMDGGSDVYVMPSEGGPATRLTFEGGQELPLGWTKDGKVAYASSWMSNSDRMRRLWVVDPKGGMPQSTSLMEVSDASFSPDGRTVAFNRNISFSYNWRMYRGGTQGRISFFNLDTKAYSEMPQGREQSWHPMWVGDDVYFVSDRNQGTVNLYRWDTKARRSEQLTRFNDGDIKFPNTDGKTIVWERNGRMESYSIGSGKVETVTPYVVSDDKQLRPRWRSFAAQVGNFAVSPSGRRMVVEARGRLFSVPATSGETRQMTPGNESRQQSPVWTPDGQQVAYMSDETGEWQITFMPQRGGEPRTLRTPADHRISSFRLSPSGKWVSYTTTDFRLFTISAEGGAPTLVHQDLGSPASYDWSPDEQWIVYTATLPNFNTQIRLYNVRERKSTAVTDGMYSDGPVTFDLNGKYIYFVSARTFGFTPNAVEGPTLHQSNLDRVYVLPLSKELGNPLEAPSDEEDGPARAGAGGPGGAPGGAPAAPAAPETKVDFEGINGRAVALPWPNGNFGFVLGAQGGVYTFLDGALVQFSLAARQSIPILQGISSVSFNPNRTKIGYQAPGGITGIIDARPGSAPPQGRVNLNDVAGMWDPRAEFRQMFWEVWRYQRDTFYDPGMMGLDWRRVGAKYSEMLPLVTDRADMNYIFGLLIGELGTGHAYITGPGEVDSASGPATGMLGVDFAVEDGKLRMTKIYRGMNAAPNAAGPLGAPGVDVKDGEYLLAIDGKPVDGKSNPLERLIDKVGKTVNLTVSATPDGPGRRVAVRPIASEGNLRYETWVAERRELVNKLSGGRIGYMHVPDTSIGGIIGFMRGFYSQSDKEAFLIDERFNGGGFIPTFFVEYLQRQMNTAMRRRNGADIGFPTQSLDGPKAMLINEHAGSGGDMFPWLFKNTGVGPLIGTRTWGGLVGISGGLGLVDGGGVTSPGFGIYDTKAGKWIAENTGVDPDITVDNDPGVWARGADAQLEAGVKWLMDQLRAGKGRAPFKRPDFPRVQTGTGGR